MRAVVSKAAALGFHVVDPVPLPDGSSVTTPIVPVLVGDDWKAVLLWRALFDAGVYDNYGVQVAWAWIHKNFDWLRENTSGVVLVQIRDAISSDARRSAIIL